MARKNTPENAHLGPASASGQPTGAAEDPSQPPSQAPSQPPSQQPPPPLPADEPAASADVPEGFDRRQTTVDRRQFDRVVESPLPRREAD